MALTSSFTAHLAGAKAQPVFVILGVQGSGTNLLRRILVGAFNFSVVQDQAIIYNAALKLGPHPSREAIRRQFDFIRSRLAPSSLTRKTGRRIKSNSSFVGIEEHFDNASIATGSDLAHYVYAYSAFGRGTRLMAIKSDDLWETIGHIDTVLPNRRIILLTRDFRDNLLSITKKNFGPIEPVVAARYVKDRFAYYDAEYRRTPPEHRIHVRYEDLLEEPDAFVARFCEHFGLAAAGHAPSPVKTERIRRDNVKKWATLSARELSYCEAILQDELQSYGYGIESERVRLPGASTWLFTRVRDAVRRVPQKVSLVVNRFLK